MPVGIRDAGSLFIRVIVAARTALPPTASLINHTSLAAAIFATNEALIRANANSFPLPGNVSPLWHPPCDTESLEDNTRVSMIIKYPDARGYFDPERNGKSNKNWQRDDK